METGINSSVNDLYVKVMLVYKWAKNDLLTIFNAIYAILGDKIV